MYGAFRVLRQENTDFHIDQPAVAATKAAFEVFRPSGPLQVDLELAHFLGGDIDVEHGYVHADEFLDTVAELVAGGLVGINHQSPLRVEPEQRA